MNTQVAERRPMGALGRMAMVAGLHGAVLYLIASSLGIVPSLVPEPVIPAQVFDEPRDPVDPAPTPVQPRLREDLDIPIERPEVDIAQDPLDDPPHVIIGGETPPPVIIDDTRGTQMVGVRPDSRHPLSQPAYPLTDVRQGNEGAVELEVYVLPSGRVGDVRVLKSTGSPTLDQSAMEEARRKWRLLPATRDGEPYAQWHRLRVVFNLKDR
jgi:periplasmic protein TonB